MPTSPPTNADGTGTTPFLSSVAQPARLNLRTAWTVLVSGLIITAAATLYMKSSVESIAGRDFADHSGDIQKKITNRLDDHARILQSGAAFFHASDSATREEWRIFTRAQKLEEQLPGIQGIGFSLLITRKELTRHIQGIRKQGFPGYTLRPDGNREIYTSIIYLEPSSGRNMKAFGYDMFSEPVRRAAMEHARDTDNAALSGKVVLVQETGTEVQAGTLMFVPVYRKGMPVETRAQRRAAIYGWVYSPYRMNDLMQGILGGHDLEKEQLHLEVFDGSQPSSESLLYQNHAAKGRTLPPDARFTREIPVNFNGHLWTLRFKDTGGGFFTVEYLRVWLTLAGGTLVTLLLFALIRTLLNSSYEAQHLVEALHESASLLKEAQRIGRLGSLDWNVKTNELALSDEALEIFGFGKTKNKPALQELVNVVHPEDRGRVEKSLQLAASGGAKHDMEHRLVLSDGKVIHVQATAELFRDAEGKPVRLLGTIHDITERKRAEEKIREKDIQFRKLSSNVPDLIYQFTRRPDGTYIVPIASEGIKNIFGCSPEDVLEDFAPIARVIYPEDSARVLNDIEFSAKHLTLFSCDFRVQIPGKTLQWIASRSTPEKLSDGSITWYGFNADITERKNAEREQFRLLTIIENSLNEIYLFDATTLKFEYANRGALANIGYSLEEMKGITALAIKPRLTEAEFQAMLRPLLAGEKDKIVFETTHRRKDGTDYLAESNIQLHRQENRSVFSVIVNDITDRKQKEKIIEDKNAELERFTYTVSHDLKSPLVTIKTFLGFVEQDLDNNYPAQAKKDMVFIHKAADKMVLLLNELLELSRVGRVGNEPVRITLQELVDEALSMVAGRIAEKKVEVQVGGADVVLYGNRQRFAEIWQNLVENSVKYMGDQKAPRIDIGTEARGPDTVFFVRDNGMGIDPRYKDKVFGLFDKLDPKSEGSGLGLALVKRIVELYHGNIWFESAGDGKGTCFKFTLPEAVKGT